jgi:transposase
MSGPVTDPTHVMVASTRRSWSREHKRAIIAETQNPGTTISAVARRHGVQPSLLFRWRRDALDEERAAALAPQPVFIPLSLPNLANTASCERPPTGMIEIELAGGHRLRADASVDVAVLRSVIEALVGR